MFCKLRDKIHDIVKFWRQKIAINLMFNFEESDWEEHIYVCGIGQGVYI